MSSIMNQRFERLFHKLGSPAFLDMQGLANEMPIFIQTYEPDQEDSMRKMLESLVARLRSKGITVVSVDLFDLVIEELEEHGLLDDLLRDEATCEKIDMLETLENYSDPETHLVPRLIRAIGEGTQLTLVTGSGRIYPFLRTHKILESLQTAMLRHPLVIFFPGEYTQDINSGSYLRLFGAIPTPVINKPFYRATNLDHYAI